MTRWNRTDSWGGKRAFTLIEILIVGALLTLFAGIAIFNIQTMFNNNRRKAAIGETHQLATALDFAHQDLSFFPNFNYLTLPASLVTTASGDARSDFDYMGFYSRGFRGRAPAAVVDSWGGAYFAMSQGRVGVSQGRSGIVKVRLASRDSKFAGGVNGQDTLADSLVDWPADVWGTPYVLYMFKVDKGGDPEWKFPESFTDKADYHVAVVSYGPDKVPGSLWRKRTTTTTPRWGAPGGSPALPPTKEQLDARLFLDGDWDLTIPNPQPTGGPAQFTMLRPVGAYSYHTNNRDRIWKGPKDGSDSALVAAWEREFPPPTPDLEVRGMTDPGSDDIVYLF